MSALYVFFLIAFTVAWLGLLVAIGYAVLFPAIIGIGYRIGGLSLDEFREQGGGGKGAAGSEDAVYMAARFDCRKGVITRLVGPPPDALYWMIGIYDNRLQRIPGGHVNSETVEVEEDGKMYLTIQPLPGPTGNTLECRKHLTGLVLLRVFLPKDSKNVVAPTIERVITEQGRAG